MNSLKLEGFQTLLKNEKTMNYGIYCNRDYDNLYRLANPAWES